MQNTATYLKLLSPPQTQIFAAIPDPQSKLGSHPSCEIDSTGISVTLWCGLAGIINDYHFGKVF